MTLDVDKMVDAFGNIPGEFMNFGFLMLKPLQLMVQKYLGFVSILDDERQCECHADCGCERTVEWPDDECEACRRLVSELAAAMVLGVVLQVAVFKAYGRIGHNLSQLSETMVTACWCVLTETPRPSLP